MTMPKRIFAFFTHLNHLAIKYIAMDMMVVSAFELISHYVMTFITREPP